MLRMKGFNLIELVVAIAIVGILAAVAYPSYNDSVRKSRRAEAKAMLAEQAQWMERIYSESFDYTDGNSITKASLPVNNAPKPGITKYYDFEFSSINVLTANTFQLIAKPVSGGPQADDGCGTLTLTHQGVKGVEDQKTGYDADTCW